MDIQNFTKTPGGAVQVNVPKFTIECQLVDSNGGILSDFTGANAIQFPSVLVGLTNAQYREIMDTLAPLLIKMKSGL